MSSSALSNHADHRPDGQKPSMDRRSRARELAMQALYQLDIQGDVVLAALRSFFVESGEDDMVRQLAEDWTNGAWKNLAVCDELIQKAAIRWELSRLSCVDRSILRLAVYQLRFCPDIPGKVILNEAIELAKKFSGDQSPRFVNGVLDAIHKTLRLSSDSSRSKP